MIASTFIYCMVKLSDYILDYLQIYVTQLSLVSIKNICFLQLLIIQGKLRPEPRQWYHSPTDYELKIPKSSPLTYTQLPFYLHGLVDTPEIRNLISAIRDLCKKFEGRGLPNYPSGIPFIFWEQYMDLRTYLSLIILSVLCATFVCVGILLLSTWAAILIVFNAVATLIQLIGIMTFLSIKLSAIPAVIMVLSVGLSVSFTIHVSLVSFSNKRNHT